MDQESGFSIEPGDESVFGEAVRQADRQRAARTVRDWLSGYPEAGGVDPTKLSLRQISLTILEHLEEGGIFFVVKSADEVDAPVKARRVRVSLPPITHPLIKKTGTLRACLKSFLPALNELFNYRLL